MLRIPVLLGCLLALLAVLSHRPQSARPRASSSARCTPAAATPARRTRTTSSNSSTRRCERRPHAAGRSSTRAASQHQLVGDRRSAARSRRAGHYLVQLASTAAVGSALPAPEATGTTNLAASGGKVALVPDATALACGATAGSCAAPRSSGPRRVRQRRRTTKGPAPAPALSSTTAAQRGRLPAARTPATTPPTSHPAAPDAAQLGTRQRDLRRRSTAERQRVAGRTGRRRRRVAALDQPRALEPQLRSGVAPGRCRRRSPRRVTVTGNVAAGYSLDVHRVGVRAGRPPARHRDQRADGRQLGPGWPAGASRVPIAPAADLVIGTTRGPERRERRRLAGDARLHGCAAGCCPPGGTRRRSPSRCSAGDQAPQRSLRH